MVMTASTMLGLGTQAPDFSLPDTEGGTVSRSDFAGKPLLVVFMCNHCPFVKHVARQLKALGDDYMPKGVAMVGISANDVSTHPDDSPENMKSEKAARGYAFPYLYDADQSVAKAYTAACTPDVFLFDAEHNLVYRGQLDETRPKRLDSGAYDYDHPASDGKDLRAALDTMLNGGSIPAEQTPSMGCNIKWKAGSEPSYFGG
ncbi:thioredoxin family protein [Mucisphaera calidilacus]|uniref:Peroxiredoxin n=1 Tax=Mucisphaera calidilacus TaxID=2527982 RepID=A0A518BYE3_9BACT|nr:Putative peroxiredoxin [Mucisphaera calidilacus]